MAKKNPDNTKRQDLAFNQQLNAKLKRKIKAQAKINQTIWSGLGMMGLVGWAIAVPTLLGAAFGIWIDKHYPSVHSWTLALLMLGLVLGCVNAWHWVEKEQHAIGKQHENSDE
jgi:ATP synthase protein I